jgi:formylglycine-generating enzyme required for sulfatase activity
MKRFHCTVLPLIAVVSVTAFSSCPPRDVAPVAGETRTFDTIVFQWCPPGSFTMGSPETEGGRSMTEVQHVVHLSKGFWLSQTEITQNQWHGVMGNNPSYFDDAGNENNPVDTVTWDQVQDFLTTLNALAGDTVYRLPTESEWEYANRAGVTTRFYWGVDPGEVLAPNNAWYLGNSGGTTHPAGEKLPNAWGLCDMNGNVSEWCQDISGDYPAGPVTDPLGAASGEYRVIRGGSHETGFTGCRSAGRSSFLPISTNSTIGFRLLRTQD